MTISHALKLATTKLRAKNIDNPPLEAEILLSGVLRKPREFLFIHPEARLSKLQIARYQRLLKRRLKGEPVAYLTGHKEFYGLDFMVNKNVLIPRPETELMVEEALKLVTRNPQPVTLVDVGTGSGCTIVTLAKSLNHELKTKNQKFFGIDISTKALALAKNNAKAHAVNEKIKFISGDLLKPILNCKFYILNSKFLILANLPYGWKAWKNNYSMDTVGLKFEPAIALFTDKNGLGLYEKLFCQIKTLAEKLPVDCYALCEFDPRQTKMMKKLIKRELPFAEYQIKKDLAGLNRLAIIKI